MFNVVVIDQSNFFFEKFGVVQRVKRRLLERNENRCISFAFSGQAAV